MGIQGLLPFLKKIHTPVNISQFKGCTVAIDAYCWLHKGAFSCADKLALGEKTEQYVYYCMKYVDCLLRSGLKPILVFDGCHLPSKKDVETSRRERRELNRKRAAQLLREGKRTEAKECLQRCVDISPQMALQLMNVCRARGVDCIVAPYEADAQLAYLNKAGIAQLVITEDSDLLLFGCDKVIFKMDFFGNGVLIEQSRLNEVVDIQDGFYTFDKFRYMCILSGCDYLPSLPGIGLAKACKVFKVARQADMRQLLKKVPSYLKMNLVVSEDYIEGFIRADNTFLYQLAFDPLTRKLCPLTPYPPEIDAEELTYAGPYFSNKLGLQIAFGNLDIHTHEKIGDFDPDTFVPKHAKNQSEKPHWGSIWKRSYRPCNKSDVAVTKGEDSSSQRPCLAGKEVQVKNTVVKRSPAKRVRQVQDGIDVKTDTELTDLYSADTPQRKRRRDSDDITNRVSTSAFSKPLQITTDDFCDCENAAERQPLSPSKSFNQPPPKPAAASEDVFSLIDQESPVIVQEKENGKKGVTPKRNKFAVSALAKRAKFNLDSPSLPNVQMEIKSRYFGSSTSPAICSSQQKQTNSDNKDTHSEKTSHCSFAEKREEETAALFNISSKSQGSDKGEEEWKRDKSHLSNNSSLSKFCYKSENKSEVSKSSPTVKESPAKINSTEAGSTSHKPSKHSPGSAFSWSSFKFTKCSSTPTVSPSTSQQSNKQFKRVLSDKTPERKGVYFGVIDSQGDSRKASQNSGHDFDELSQSKRKRASLRDCQDGGESVLDLSGSQQSTLDLDASQQSTPDLDASQQSTPDLDASQHSNLYSIDSDNFPNSQDILDLTDCDADNFSVNSADSSSPASQMSLKLSSLTPRSTSGIAAKKCRVSGLSRGKKKPSAGVDEKQQKIRDMFSRFAHQKKPKLDCTPTLSVEPTDSGSETPSSHSLSQTTETNRKLVL